MFSIVLGMLRPSEKAESCKKVNFGELLKRCNFICSCHFGILSGRHIFAQNLIFTLSDGKLKNHKRQSKAHDCHIYRYRFGSKKMMIWGPKRFLFQVHFTALTSCLNWIIKTINMHLFQAQIQIISGFYLEPPLSNLKSFRSFLPCLNSVDLKPKISFMSVMTDTLLPDFAI